MKSILDEDRGSGWKQETAMTEDRFKWFREASYGVFIHWGVYAMPGSEWKGTKGGAEWLQMRHQIPNAEYSQLAGQFNPVDFNAEEWVGLAKDAGMQYLVITTKHHDGFCMFDSKLTDYNIVKATPFGRDPMKELSRACEKAGIKLCFYYSVKDWHHPEYPTLYTRRTPEQPEGFHGEPNPDADYHKYLDYLEGQVSELLTNYGPVGLIFFDMDHNGPAEPENRERAEKVVETIHRLQPDCLINNRFGGIGADYGTPENYIPGGQLGSPFEVCMTLNNSWGFNKHDHNWKDAKTVVQNLADIRSKGGNFLLNVGPTGEGLIPKPSVEILRDAGQWLQTNGESIYGATPPAPLLRVDKMVDKVTAKPGRYYLHLFSWPEDRRVFVIDFFEDFTQAYFLADKSKAPLETEVYRRSLNIHLPEEPIDPWDTVIVIEYNK